MIPRHIRCLPNLMNVSEAEIADRSIEGRTALVEKMEATLRNMRLLGLDRHHSYELATHSALFSIYKRERDELAIEQMDAAFNRAAIRLDEVLA